eukprot:XP_014790418.1 PREDICTED: solute carrier family 13 member 5-like isoform X2 [Octopus bimaculoides]
MAILLFILPSKVSSFTKKGYRQDLEDWTPILNWKTIQNKLPWGIVLVMGGGFAIADVSRVSTGFLINVVCVLTLTLAVHS